MRNTEKRPQALIILAKAYKETQEERLQSLIILVKSYNEKHRKKGYNLL